MSPRWGSIEQSNIFYKNDAPLELKGRTPKQIFVFKPQRGDILVDPHVFCIRAPAGRYSCRTFQSVFIYLIFN